MSVTDRAQASRELTGSYRFEIRNIRSVTEKHGDGRGVPATRRMGCLQCGTGDGGGTPRRRRNRIRGDASVGAAEPGVCELG